MISKRKIRQIERSEYKMCIQSFQTSAGHLSITMKPHNSAWGVYWRLGRIVQVTQSKGPLTIQGSHLHALAKFPDLSRKIFPHFP